MAVSVVSVVFRRFPLSGRALCATLAQLALSLVCALGCGSKSASADDPNQDAAARSEAARLCHAIDRLRQADNAQKGEWLKALDGEACTSLCPLKQVCQSAYQEHVSALDAIREVKAYGAAPPAPGSSAGAQVSEKLSEAERRLRTSREMAERCVESESEAKRRYRL